jgi:hypothetical protein
MFEFHQPVLKKSNIGWPQQPPTKTLLKFNMIFPDSTQNFFFQNIKTKLNSRTWMTLRSSVVIFPTLEPMQPKCPLQPQQPPWPQFPLQPHFIRKVTDPDVLIISGTKMTNTGTLLVELIIKNPNFHCYLNLFCWRLLRPADVTFLKPG